MVANVRGLLARGTLAEGTAAGAETTGGANSGASVSPAEVATDAQLVNKSTSGLDVADVWVATGEDLAGVEGPAETAAAAAAAGETVEMIDASLRRPLSAAGVAAASATVNPAVGLVCGSQETGEAYKRTLSCGGEGGQGGRLGPAFSAADSGRSVSGEERVRKLSRGVDCGMVTGRGTHTGWPWLRDARDAGATAKASRKSCAQAKTCCEHELCHPVHAKVAPDHPASVARMSAFLLQAQECAVDSMSQRVCMHVC